MTGLKSRRGIRKRTRLEIVETNIPKAMDEVIFLFVGTKIPDGKNYNERIIDEGVGHIVSFGGYGYL